MVGNFLFKKSQEFQPPNGICFRFGDMRAADLSSVLKKLASFLQAADPHISLYRYDDWWEHDGLHFKKAKISFAELFEFVKSPKVLLESTPHDDFVFVGIAPEDACWYLRYRVEWDDDETELIGSCDLVLPTTLANIFRESAIPKLATMPIECDSESFYNQVIL